MRRWLSLTAPKKGAREQLEGVRKCLSASVCFVLRLFPEDYSNSSACGITDAGERNLSPRRRKGITLRMVSEKEKTFVSAVVYLHNDGAEARRFFQQLYAILDMHFENFEFIAVDDSCTDDTVALLKEWAKDCPKPLSILHMSLYHGLEDAMNAGIDAAIGDFVYEFDTMLTPYGMELVYDAYHDALAGNDIVCVCPRRMSWSSRLFYKVFNSNSNTVYQLQTDVFRLVTRRAINRVHASNPFMPYRKAAYATSGLKIKPIPFEGNIVSAQKSRLTLAIDSLVLYTKALYRLSIGITFFMMLVAGIELAYTLAIFCLGRPVEGWTTTMLVMTLGFLGLFFILSIIIKYLCLNLDMMFRKQKYLIESIEKL